MRRLMVWGALVALCMAGCVGQGERPLTAAALAKIDAEIRQCQQAIARNPRDASAYSNLGCAYRARGDQDKAIPLFDRAIALDPDLVNAYYNLGNAWYDKKEYARAITQYEKVLSFDKNDRDVLYNLGLAYHRIGDTQKGLACMKRAADLGNEEAKKALVFIALDWRKPGS